MSPKNRKRASDEDHKVSRRADAVSPPGTRRDFVRLVGVGGLVVLLPTLSGDRDDESTSSPPLAPDAGRDGPVAEGDVTTSERPAHKRFPRR